MRTALLLGPLILGLAGATPASPATTPPRGYRPRVTLWTDRDQVYRPGQPVRLFLETDVDAFVTVFRVDTDGRLRVLFPLDPYGDTYLRGGRRHEIAGWRRSYAFTVDDYPGLGYLFAIAAADPFDYRNIVRADHWDYDLIGGGRVHGDPYVALTDLAWSLLPEDYPDWDYDIATYSVGSRYDYPRFLCYDCHAYVGYPYWDPYAHSCIRFRIVIYDDPYYYPYRYAPGTQVVFARPVKPAPRYVFRTWDQGDAYVTRVKERPVNPRDRREVADRRDRGGVGTVPAPGRRPVERGAEPRPSTREAPERAGPSRVVPRAKASTQPEPERGDAVRDKEAPRRATPSKIEPPRGGPKREPPRPTPKLERRRPRIG